MEQKCRVILWNLFIVTTILYTLLNSITISRTFQYWVNWIHSNSILNLINIGRDTLNTWCADILLFCGRTFQEKIVFSICWKLMTSVYMYKVAKLALSSQVASKRGLTTFNKFIFIFTKWQNQAILAYRLKFLHNVFLSRVFGFRKNSFGCHKIGSNLTLFLNKVNEHHGMGNIYTLFDQQIYNKMAPLRFAKSCQISEAT